MINKETFRSQATGLGIQGGSSESVPHNSDGGDSSHGTNNRRAHLPLHPVQRPLTSMLQIKNSRAIQQPSGSMQLQNKTEKNKNTLGAGPQDPAAIELHALNQTRTHQAS